MYKAARRLDYKLPTQWGEYTHSNTHTRKDCQAKCYWRQTNKTWRKKEDQSTHKCVCVHTKSVRRISCLWSFCTESMKQACLLNRVFIHFGLWCWDQRTVKHYKQTRGDLKVRVCVRVCVFVCVCKRGKCQEQSKGREQTDGASACMCAFAVFVSVLNTCHTFVCVCVCANYHPPLPFLLRIMIEVTSTLLH